MFLCQVINECILCVHGGLSPDIKTLDQVRTIERNQEIPHKGAFCGILLMVKRISDVHKMVIMKHCMIDGRFADF
jgi:hypothetical protein